MLLSNADPFNCTCEDITAAFVTYKNIATAETDNKLHANNY